MKKTIFVIFIVMFITNYALAGETVIQMYLVNIRESVKILVWSLPLTASMVSFSFRN